MEDEDYCFEAGPTITRCKHYLSMDLNDRDSIVCEQCENSWKAVYFEVSGTTLKEF